MMRVTRSVGLAAACPCCASTRAEDATAMQEKISDVYSALYCVQGRSLFVKLGDKDVEYNKNFKLILHTKLSNPHYPPEIQAETTLINFTVTESGLEDQLLALVVNKERPDLEETKTQLIIQNTDFTIKLKQVSCCVHAWDLHWLWIVCMWKFNGCMHATQHRLMHDCSAWKHSHLNWASCQVTQNGVIAA